MREKVSKKVPTLMDEVSDQTGAQRAASALARQYCALHPDVLHASPVNPRGEVTDADVADLVQSIREHGLLQPLVVRHKETLHPIQQYEVIAGHRRLHAARLAGLQAVRCMVVSLGQGRVLDDATALELMLTENSSRVDVSPLRESLALVALAKQHGRSVAELAARTGRTERWVRQRMALADLVPEWRERLEAGLVTLGAAVLLAGTDAERQQRLAERFRREPDSDVVAVRDVAWFVREGRRLDRAPWYLWLEVGGRPACESCPKRTDRQMTLIDEGGIEPGSCLDGACWDAKWAYQRAAGAIVETEMYGTIPTTDAYMPDKALRDLVPRPDTSHWNSQDKDDDAKESTTLADVASPRATVWVVSTAYNRNEVVGRGVRPEMVIESLQSLGMTAEADGVAQLVDRAKSMRDTAAARAASAVVRKTPSSAEILDRRIKQAVDAVYESVAAGADWMLQTTMRADFVLEMSIIDWLATAQYTSSGGPDQHLAEAVSKLQSMRSMRTWAGDDVAWSEEWRFYETQWRAARLMACVRRLWWSGVPQLYRVLVDQLRERGIETDLPDTLEALVGECKAEAQRLAEEAS